MTVLIDKIASDLSIDTGDLERLSLIAYFDREMRLVQQDIEDLQDRYQISSSDALARAINEQQIYAHPAWEDLIEWEQLIEYQERLNRWKHELEQNRA